MSASEKSGHALGLRECRQMTRRCYEVETLEGDRWVVGDETLSLRPRQFEGSLEDMLVDTNRLGRTIVNGPAFEGNNRLDSMTPETPSVSQLSQVISQAAAPGFILAALAGFTSLLIARQNRIVDRTIFLNGISDDDPVKGRLKADLPRLLRRAAMMNRAILWALISGIAIAVLVVVAFTSALLHIQHEVGVAILFIVALVAFTISLVEFAREVRIALNELDHHG